MTQSPSRGDSTDGAALIGVVAVSDRASRGEYEDRGGPAVRAYLERVLATPLEFEYQLVSDDRVAVAATLRELADDRGCCLIVTTGGTGPAERDVTVDATLDVLDKVLPGFGEAMRAVSLTKVPTAVLSRQTAGIRGGALIVNLPGSPKAIDECLAAVIAAVPDCVDLIGGPRLELRDREAYRPHG